MGELRQRQEDLGFDLSATMRVYLRSGHELDKGSTDVRLVWASRETCPAEAEIGIAGCRTAGTWNRNSQGRIQQCAGARVPAPAAGGGGREAGTS